ncbi:DUF1992 domain-containing protein [Brachybacterium sp. YJGR34]|uniref:DnaJ family domain-containing protein n=1 Tax=Brachybacterium sp. YJGR34 TaxID=2059911 RepID=UPI000E0B43AD|nr:DUF1992 domain-containing protein [Brachybacterium sp. YJGR34]
MTQEPVDPRTLGPPMDPDVARVESAIERAEREGRFEDLPGAGKPLDLPTVHDPDWWIKQKIASGEIDSEALLPAVVLLRREFDDREATLRELLTEQAAREYAEDFTHRVHADRRANPFQRMLAPAWDADDAAAQWRALQADIQAVAVPPPAPEPERPAPRRRWWPFGRRG